MGQEEEPWEQGLLILLLHPASPPVPPSSSWSKSSPFLMPHLPGHSLLSSFSFIPFWPTTRYPDTLFSVCGISSLPVMSSPHDALCVWSTIHSTSFVPPAQGWPVGSCAVQELPSLALVELDVRQNQRGLLKGTV